MVTASIAFLESALPIVGCIVVICALCVSVSGYSAKSAFSKAICCSVVSAAVPVRIIAVVGEEAAC
jgi:hypothetical protein